MNFGPLKLLSLAIVFTAIVVGLWIYQSAESHGGMGFTADTSDKAKGYDRESQDSALMSDRDSTHDLIEKGSRYAIDSRQLPLGQSFRNPPVESRIIRDGGLKTEVVDELLSSEDFQDVIRKLYEENVGNQEAVEKTEMYRHSIDAVLTQLDGSIHGTDIACGANVCALEFATKGSDGSSYFETILDSSETTKAKLYSVATRDFLLKDGSYAHRMIFTSNPAVNKMIVPARPPSKK